MSPDAIALAAAERLAPRLGRRLPAAVARALAAAPSAEAATALPAAAPPVTAPPVTAPPATALPVTAPPTAESGAALDAIAAWMLRAARQVDDADRAAPEAGIERLFDHLGRPSGASPAIARVVLAEVIAAAVAAVGETRAA